MKYILILFLIVSCNCTKAQSSEHFEDGYFRSLLLHIELMKEYNKSLDTVFVSKDSHLKDFSGSVNGVFIKMVGEEFVQLKTEKKHSLTLLVIHPLEYEENKSFIIVSTFGVSRKRNNYTMLNSGSSKVEIKYDCENGNYKYDIVSLH